LEAIAMKSLTSWLCYSGALPLGLLLWLPAPALAESWATALASTKPIEVSSVKAQEREAAEELILESSLVLAKPTSVVEFKRDVALTPVEEPTESTPSEPASEPVVPSELSEPEATPTPKPDDPSLLPPEEPGADLTPDRQQQLLIEADRLWQQGRREDAEFLYRKAKNPFQAVAVSDRPDPITDPAQLPPAGQVYWREAAAGQQLNLATRMLVPLELLTEQYPQFIPGHLLYTQVLLDQDKPDTALEVMERATTFYPNQVDLVQTRVTLLAEQDRYLEASIAARQFAVLHPNDPTAAEFTALADENLRRHRSRLRARMRENAIANVLTGALSYALGGGLFGPFTAIQSTVLLLRGESDVGEGVARQLSRQLDLVEDEEVVAYVNEIGQRVAAVSGRSEFNYEFYVVSDRELNAFALPGGKVFINAGAILETESEAELAALLAHELSHAVLSHGFQLVTQGNLTANVFQFIPYGGIASDLAVLSYSRDMERQADELGTRMLAAAGYAADGLRNLMVTLQAQDEPTAPFEWLSTHPDTDERIQRMEQQIEQNGYNRYAFEGVERHLAIQQQVEELLGPESEDETDSKKGAALRSL
jgi:predicted Zn-dependent protease